MKCLEGRVEKQWIKHRVRYLLPDSHCRPLSPVIVSYFQRPCSRSIEESSFCPTFNTGVDEIQENSPSKGKETTHLTYFRINLFRLKYIQNAPSYIRLRGYSVEFLTSVEVVISPETR